MSGVATEEIVGPLVSATKRRGVLPGSIEARRFSFWYGPKQALFDIDLTLHARSVTALIGPSGCGKSTFLRSINRMNELIPGVRKAGEILLDGADIYGPGSDVVALRQRAGMVFQRWNPFPKSIYENVAFGPRINGERDTPSWTKSSSGRSAAPCCGTR